MRVNVWYDLAWLGAEGECPNVCSERCLSVRGPPPLNSSLNRRRGKSKRALLAASFRLAGTPKGPAWARRCGGGGPRWRLAEVLRLPSGAFGGFLPLILRRAPGRVTFLGAIARSRNLGWQASPCKSGSCGRLLARGGSSSSSSAREKGGGAEERRGEKEEEERCG